jgi:hypothetical protein
VRHRAVAADRGTGVVLPVDVALGHACVNTSTAPRAGCRR